MEIKRSRKQRAKITLELLRVIRNQIDNGYENKRISTFNNISISCARIISIKMLKGLSDVEIISKKGRKSVGKTEIRASISSIINNDNSITQRGIVKALESEGIIRTQTFVSKEIRSMNLSRKRLSIIPIERNNERTCEIRLNYCREVINIPFNKLVFLDETGFNVHTSQSYGYSLKNTKAFTRVKANKGVSQSLMCAITSEGIICHEMVTGAYNGDRFKSFINIKLLPYFENHCDYVIIMDNCRFHHRADVLALLRENNIAYKFTPPYTPQLNPIEEFFSSIKARYKSIRPRPTNASEIKTAVDRVLEDYDISLVPFFDNMRGYVMMGLNRSEFK